MASVDMDCLGLVPSLDAPSFIPSTMNSEKINSRSGDNQERIGNLPDLETIQNFIAAHQYLLQRPSKFIRDLIEKSPYNEAQRKCKFHSKHVTNTFKRSYLQYIYDENNVQYLDCINGLSHVGHCEINVVQAAATLAPDYLSSNSHELLFENITYPEEIRSHLPEELSELLFCNSGSEAVDISVDLCLAYTKGEIVFITEDSFHGCLDTVSAYSAKLKPNHEVSNVIKIPIPDIYNGKFTDRDTQAVEKYINEALEIIDTAAASGKKIGCLLIEPLLVLPGYLIPSKRWLQAIVEKIRSYGGLCVADEVQTGFGRLGSHFWAFELQGIKPDAVIIGKAIGNGFPMSIAAVTKELVQFIQDKRKYYSCTSRMNAHGLSVLRCMQTHNYMRSAAKVGTLLKQQLITFKIKHEHIGDVRGYGLLLGIEIVWSKESREPSREIAEFIIYRLMQEKIMMANEGKSRNILMIVPPICMKEADANNLCSKLEEILTEIETNGLPLLSKNESDVDFSQININDDASKSSQCIFHDQVCSGVQENRFGIYQSIDYDNLSSSPDSSTEDMQTHRFKYQDLD